METFIAFLKLKIFDYFYNYRI